ncbi:MAG: filamentous hemagglutinin N-terminal domain-containing protein, partial [Gammaproteobacteria bacterium]
MKNLSQKTRHIRAKKRLNQRMGVFPPRPIALVVATLVFPPSLMALPGSGHVVLGTVNGTAAGSDLPSIGNPVGSLSVDSARAVISWGNPLVPDPNPPGFNVGMGETLNVIDNAPGDPALLNVDISGKASSILGTIDAGGNGGVRMFIANENGIVVGPGAVITAPRGFGLLGADMTPGPVVNDFSNGTVRIDFSNGGGSVDVQDGADLSGVGDFLLIAGAGPVNLNASDPALAPGPGVDIHIAGAVNGTQSTAGGPFTPGNAATLLADVNLNLGTGTKLNPPAGIVGGTPFAHGSDIALWVHGNVTNTGAIKGYFDTNDWDGTFDNQGIIDGGSFLTISVSNLGFSTAGGLGPAQRGDLNNSGTLGANSGLVSVTGVQNVINSGLIQAGGTAATPASSASVLISNVASVTNTGTIAAGVASGSSAFADVIIRNVTGDVTNAGGIRAGT